MKCRCDGHQVFAGVVVGDGIFVPPNFRSSVVQTSGEHVRCVSSAGMCVLVRKCRQMFLLRFFYWWCGAFLLIFSQIAQPQVLLCACLHSLCKYRNWNTRCPVSRFRRIMFLSSWTHSGKLVASNVLCTVCVYFAFFGSGQCWKKRIRQCAATGFLWKFSHMLTGKSRH